MSEASFQRPFVSRAAEFVKFSHTVFALPFALIAMLVAAQGWPTWPVFLWILVCMVGARTAAMAFNRIADWELDKANPRTEGRHKLMSRASGKALVLVASVVFFLGCWNLNMLCTVLSPLALGIIFVYSLTKRFTSGAHFFLGLALAVAPIGAWAAVRGELYDAPPYILGLAVLLWVSGFDLIYATQDAEYDRKAGLYSVPARFGIPFTLRLARMLHIGSALVLAGFGWIAGLGWFYGLAWLVAAGCLVYEHRLSATGDVGLINKAFFQVNTVVSLSLLAGTGLHYLIA